MAALIQSGIRSGSIAPPVSSSAPQAAASSAARSCALLGSRRVGGEEQVAAVGVEAELAPRLGARHRLEAAEVGAAGKDRGAGQERQARAPVLLAEEGAETPRVRSMRRARRRDSGPTSGWRTSVPWKLTTSGAAPARRAHQPGSP